MYNFKIFTNIDSNWNENLTKSNHGNFFQTAEYISSNSRDFFPVFVYVFDEDKNVVGQLTIQVIKTTVLYSSPIIHKIARILSKITLRGIWLYGPVIHSSDKQSHIEILRILIKAVDEILERYDLVHIEGYSPPTDLLVDEDYKQEFKKNGYIVRDYVTFLANMDKGIDEIWQNIDKKARGDITRARKKCIVIKELSTHDQLKEYLLLHQQWAKTKGLIVTNPFAEEDHLWNNYKKGLEVFFLAYQNNQLISAVRMGRFNNMIHANFILNSYADPTSLGGPMLTWYVLEWAKKTGIKIYDFSGGRKNKQDTIEDKNTLVFYKKKWGGEEYTHYNFVKSRKKLSYQLYKFLFRLTQSYHKLKRKSRPSTRQTTSKTSI